MRVLSETNLGFVCCLLYGCVLVLGLFFLLMGTKQLYSNSQNTMESSLTFLSTGFALLEVLLFFFFS